MFAWNQSNRPAPHLAAQLAVRASPRAEQAPRLNGNGESTAQRPRRAFTLIELLVVIIIIGALMALLLPAISRTRVSANEARVVTEIKQLEAAITAFKVRYGSEPPSSIQIFLTRAGWDAHPVMKARIVRMWPQFNFDMPAGSYPQVPAATKVINNWDLTTTTVGGEKFIGLNAGECLLFFLGGVTTPAGTTPNGFSKNPATPFSTAGTNRDGPFFEIDSGRIIDSDNNQLPEYADSLPNQTRPYLYFSSYEGTGYVASEIGGTGLGNVYLQGTDSASAYKKQSFQIISPGYDHAYGNGGTFNPKNANTLNQADWDNLTNFHSGRLNPQ